MSMAIRSAPLDRRPATTARRRRMRPVSIAVGLIMGGLVMVTVIGMAQARSSVMGFFTPASLQDAGTQAWQGLYTGILDPWYWTFIAALCVLQFFMPGRRDQRPPSVELLADLVWYVTASAMQVTVVAFVLAGVTLADTQLTGGWSLDLQPRIGFWGLAIFAFVFADLLTWIAHWAHHMVPSLWRIHSVHHSQENLNALADNRQHVGETVITAMLVFIPSQILGLNADVAGTLTFLTVYWCAFIHANIRTNLGPLRWLVISPQAHRVHHSCLPQHYNTNFGSVFSAWDYLAGTMYLGIQEYPPTGINDTEFPLERNRDLRPWRLVAVWWAQTVYPVRAIFRMYTRRDDRPNTSVKDRGAVVAPAGVGIPAPATRVPSRLREETIARDVHRSAAPIHLVGVAPERQAATRPASPMPPASHPQLPAFRRDGAVAPLHRSDGEAVPRTGGGAEGRGQEPVRPRVAKSWAELVRERRLAMQTDPGSRVPVPSAMVVGDAVRDGASKMRAPAQGYRGPG